VAAGHSVTLTGPSTATAFSRIFLVNGGTLSLTGFTLSSEVVQRPGSNGSNGSAGMPGANGSSPGAAGKNGTAGDSGGDGKNGNPALGGAMYMEPGSKVTLTQCDLDNDSAIAASDGNGGSGGNGRRRTACTYLR